jgi:hypothetical protein
MKFNDNMVHSEWESITNGYRKDQSLVLLIFLVYFIDLPRTLNNISLTLPFADDTSVIIINKNNMNFQNKTHIVFDKLNGRSIPHKVTSYLPDLNCHTAYDAPL